MQTANGTSGDPPLYEDAFPSLPLSLSTVKVEPVLSTFQPSKTTIVLDIPLEERKQSSNKSVENDVTQAAVHANACENIAKTTGVKIDITTSKSKTLTVIITGGQERVVEAKKLLIWALKQQASRSIHVDPEFHSFLIGRGGMRKRELESNTTTRITIPPAAANKAEIVITGPKSGIDEAEKQIHELVQMRSQLGFERLKIPKMYHPFICGPNNQLLDELRVKTDTKISVPPPHIQFDEITISGKRDGVTIAANELREIYKLRSERCTTIAAKVAKEKLRLVLGPGRSGIQEILSATGVSVESPDFDSEDLILRGFPEDLGRALTMVYERVAMSTKEIITAPQNFHRILIGKKGSALAALIEGYKKVRVDFSDNSDQIVIEGPPEDVDVIVARFKAKVDELQSSLAFEMVKVDPKFHNQLIGRRGLTTALLRSNRVDLRFPNTLTKGRNGQYDDPSNITIDGDPTGVQTVKEALLSLVNRLENEKSKDIIIEPRLQQLLRTGNPSPTNEIKEQFPAVEIHWPAANGPFRQISSDSPTAYVVSLCGPRGQVDQAAERLSKLIKTLKESNYEQEVRIFKDCRPHLMGSTILNLLEETETRIQYTSFSDDGSQVARLIGRQSDVESAVQRIEKLQRSLANLKEVTVAIPSMLISKYAGEAVRLRSIKEQCEGVQIRMTKNVENQVTVSGPPEAVDKAKGLIDAMRDRVSQVCSEVIVKVDPKFHGFLIGRNGVNLARFREKFNVEFIFPDRTESDPQRATEIHIVGGKEAVAKAKSEIESMIKAMEDEVTKIFSFDPKFLNDMNSYRFSFNYPEFEKARLFWPRPPAKATDETNGTPEENSTVDSVESVTVRIVGPAACVEEASQRLSSMIEDVKAQVTVQHPITDQSHCRVLNQLRPRLTDMQRSYSVLIHLRLPFQPQVEEVDGEQIRTFGHVVLTGLSNNINDVLQNEIIPLLPTSESFDLPFEFHRKLLTAQNPTNQRVPQGRGRGRGARAEEVNAPGQGDFSPSLTPLSELQSKFKVFIRLPPRQQEADYITVKGTPSQLKDVKSELTIQLETWNAEKADWVARTYEEEFLVAECMVSRVLAEQQKIFKSFGVRLFHRARRIPVKEETEENVSPKEDDSPAGPSDEQPTVNGDACNGEKPVDLYKLGYRLLRNESVVVIMQGYKEKVDLVRKELDALVTNLGNFVCEELNIPQMIHPHLIGVRRGNIRRFEERHSVEVEFPGRNITSNAATIVLIRGEPANVDMACDDLINRANELMERFEERPPMPLKSAPQQEKSQNNSAHEFVVTNAPWDRAQQEKVPNASEFPAISNSSAAEEQ